MTTTLLALLCCAAPSAGCDDRTPLCNSCDAGSVDAGLTQTQFFPQGGPRTALDVLFVIDNSASMAAAQKRLLAEFPKMLASLRNPSTSHALPDLRIGVISTDLGAGDDALPSCERKGGDGARLQDMPRVAGCTPPQDPWIAHADGVTNIPGCSGDAAACLRDAFACIAPLGTRGCSFPAPLEAARRALDPKLGINPGFLRPGAMLLVIFLTDGDDCSARNPQLFDPQHQGLTDPLGPLTSFRCFEFGVQCDVNDRNVAGPRQGCVPAFDWLYQVEDYVAFFKQLKPPGDAPMLAAIAGPSQPVIVGLDGTNPTLQPSCKVPPLTAVPALRLAAVVKALDGVSLSLCAGDYGPALQKYGARFVSCPGSQCVERPPLLQNGAVACHAGVSPCRMPACDAGELCDEALGLCVDAGRLTDKPCGATCLERVDCEVAERGFDPLASADAPFKTIPRCPRAFFLDPALPVDACDASCPCWRLVPRANECSAQFSVTPFALQIMRTQQAAAGSLARLTCRVAAEAWASPSIQQAPQHCSLP